jgi:4-hydroxy-tetrahydrodipicolinate synthase
MKLVKGTGVAMVTPFKEDDSIDVLSLRKLTRHLVDGGVEFLVVLGSTGESAVMDEVEKDLVIRTVMEENGGKVHVMLGCGGNDTRKVSSQINEYTKKYKPDSFLSVSPFYNKPSQQGIVNHFRALSSETDLPVVLYNVPGRTSSNVLPATVLQIADECPNVLGIKEASGNIEQGMEIVLKRKTKDFLVYSR